MSEPKFEKNGLGKLVFKDKKGRAWSEINLQELIDGCNKFIEFKGFLDYYFKF